MASTAETQHHPLAAAIVSGLVLVASVDSQVMGAVAPEIAAGMGTAPQAIAASVVFYSAAAAIVALCIAKWWHGLDPSAWLPMTALLFALACLSTAAAPTTELFFVARALAGAAGGLVSALSVAALANASSYSRRGREMSGVAVAYFIAPVLGVPLGSLAADRIGWRWLFVALAFAAVAVAAGVAKYRLPSTPAVVRDRHSSTQLVDLLMRSRSTAMGFAGAFFVSGGLVGFTTYLGTWLSEAFDAGGGAVGLVYACAGLGAVAGGAFGGALADRLGKRRVAAVCSLIMALLLPLVAMMSWGAALFVGVALTAIAAALRVAPLQALVTELVEASERAAYVALRNTSSQVGIAVTVAVAGQLYSRSGMPGVALLCAALTLMAWLCTLAIVEPVAVEDAAVNHLEPSPVDETLVASPRTIRPSRQFD